MLIDYRNGQTSVVLRVKLLDSSATTGAGLTGLTSASSGLRIGTIADNEAAATAYTAAGSTVETVTTLGTYATPTASKCRFKEVDATNHPGVYEIQIADARFAVSGAKSLLISVSGATNLAQCDVCVPLRQVDPYDAVRGGMTALPNVASGNAGALLTAGTGTAQVNPSGGKVAATVAAGDIATDAITAAAVKADAATKIANEVEAQIIDDTDSEKVLLAITDKIASVNPSLSGLTLSAIATQVRTELGVELGRIDAAVTSRQATFTTSTGVTLPASVASPTNITAASGIALAANQHVIVDSGTVTTLSNLPTMPTDWITALGVSAAAVTKIQSGLALAATALSTAIWTNAKAAFIDTSISGVSTGGVSAGDIADAVCDELLSDHTNAGSLAKALSDVLDDTGTSGVVIASGSGNALVTAVATAIASDHGSGSYVRNTEPDNASIVAILDDTGTTGVKIASGTQTFNMTGNITGNLSGTVGTVNAFAANVITTASIQNGAYTDAKFTLPTEATGAPSTLFQLIMWIAGMLGWRKVEKDSGAGTVKQFMADDTTVKTSSTYNSEGGVDTLNRAG